MPGTTPLSPDTSLPVETDILDALRKATGPLHAEVDQCMPLSRPSPDLSDYRAHLRLLDGWMHALADIVPAPAPLARHRIEVAADLHACDALLPASPAEAQATAAPALARPARGAAFAWGVAYVLEGSRLGGRVLYRQLAERLAPHPLTYLQGAGEQTGAHWKAFIADLRAQGFDPADVQSSCEGAVAAFDLLLASHRTRLAPA